MAVGVFRAPAVGNWRALSDHAAMLSSDELINAVPDAEASASVKAQGGGRLAL